MRTVTNRIIGAAMDAHRAIGPGLLESVYEKCLARLLIHRGLHVDRQVQIPIEFMDLQVDTTLRVDLVVEHRVIVELKAVDRVMPLHKAQVRSYLRLSRYTTALLLNFNVCWLRDGIYRFTEGEDPLAD